MTIPTNTLTPEDLKREWRTPRYIFDPLNEIFDFTIDVAATLENTLCPSYIDEVEDALQVRLGGLEVRFTAAWVV